MNSVVRKLGNNDGIKVGIVFNLKKDSADNMPEDFYAEFDDIGVPISIKKVLEREGFRVDMLEADENLFLKLRDGGYSFVFNIAEGLYGESRESHVPAMLEMLKIPYSASGVLTQAIALDKRRTKEILLYHGIPTPRYQVFVTGNEEINPSLHYPLIVKPNSEGSSKGIKNKSLVNNESELRDMIDFVLNTYKQEVLVEEFVSGREFTVSLFGNSKRVYRLPIVEIMVDKYPKSNGVYTYEHKFVCEDDSYSCNAELNPDFKRRIYDLAISCFKILECRDMSRIDIRCDDSGEPFVLEVNPLPGINPLPEHVSYFTKACRLAGMEYSEIIKSIVYLSFERQNLLDMLTKSSRVKVPRLLERIDMESMKIPMQTVTSEMLVEAKGVSPLLRTNTLSRFASQFKGAPVPGALFNVRAARK